MRQWVPGWCTREILPEEWDGRRWGAGSGWGTHAPMPDPCQCLANHYDINTSLQIKNKLINFKNRGAFWAVECRSIIFEICPFN